MSKFILFSAVLSTAVLCLAGFALAQSSAPICPGGTAYSSTLLKCAGDIATCTPGVIYDTTTNKCADGKVPVCPSSEMR